MSEYQRFLNYHSLDVPIENQKIQSVKIIRLDNQFIPKDADEIRLFCCCRNAFRRLPFFLEYYRRLGINRFFFLEHASIDGTREYLLKQADVHLFTSKDSFSDAHGGLLWIDYLLKNYALNFWCLVADIDEFFCFDQSEVKTLQDLRNFLEAEKSSAFQVMLLDMYAKESLEKVDYQSGKNPLEVCPYYDYDTHRAGAFLIDGTEKQTHRRRVGGVRSRIFNFEPCLTKFSFFKFTSRVRLHRGCHRIWGVKLSRYQGLMLHFKFFSDFFEQMDCAVKEKNYWKDSKEYFAYQEKLKDLNEVLFYSEEHSKKMESTQSLLADHLLDEIPFSTSSALQDKEIKRDCSLSRFEFFKKIFAKVIVHRFCLSIFFSLRGDAYPRCFLDHVDQRLSESCFFKKSEILILTCDLPLFCFLSDQENFSTSPRIPSEIVEHWLSSHLSFIEATSSLPAERVCYARLEDFDQLTPKRVKELARWLSPSMIEELKQIKIKADRNLSGEKDNDFDASLWMRDYPEVKSLRKCFGYLDGQLTPELSWIK